MCLAKSLATLLSFVSNLRSARVRSAARRPAPVMTRVWGKALEVEDWESFFLRFAEPANCSRKSGRTSVVRGFSKDVVSRIAFAVPNGQQSCPYRIF